MVVTPAYRQIAPSLGLSVGAASHAAVTLPVPVDGTVVNYVLLENTSATVAVFFTLAGQGLSAPASSVPGDGTTGSACLLPLAAKVISAPAGTLSVSAIGAAAGPSLVIVTPIAIL